MRWHSCGVAASELLGFRCDGCNLVQTWQHSHNSNVKRSHEYTGVSRRVEVQRCPRCTKAGCGGHAQALRLLCSCPGGKKRWKTVLLDPAVAAAPSCTPSAQSPMHVLFTPSELREGR